MAWPKGRIADWKEIVAQAQGDDRFAWALDPEVQTDKELIKLLPCQFCKRPLIVTTFYVLAWAKCSPCAGEDMGSRAKGSVEVVQAGRTDPSLAVDLTKTLLNPAFANALCPAHPDDPEHEMELKSVNHNPNYGPYELQGYKDGKSVYKIKQPGETVMHQCNKCLAVVTYTTAVVVKFKRINEPGEGKSAMGWAGQLGVREDEVA